eukprot:3052282-Amphidinium_carterae.1
MRLAWQSFQHISGAPNLIAPVEPTQASWPKTFGFPCMEQLHTRVLIPHWQKVRERIANFPYVLGGLLTGRETKGTEPWRQWIPCIPDTQTNPVRGLECRSLLLEPLLRLSQPVAWQWQLFRARKWLDTLSHLPVMSQELGVH